MSIIYNNTTIESVKYNGNNIDTVTYNNTEVFTSEPKTLTVIGDNSVTTYNCKIIINGITYTDNNNIINIIPGTSVTLDCDFTKGKYDYGLRSFYKYSFKNWTGYTTETSQSFTFTMPNRDVTYRCYLKHEGTSFLTSGNISEDEILKVCNYNIFDLIPRNHGLTNRIVVLNENDSTTNWRILNVGANGFDLWCTKSIGGGAWAGTGTAKYWINQPRSGYVYNQNISAVNVCLNYESKLSSGIRSHLKTGLNTACGSDKVVILSARQLGESASNIDEGSDPVSNLVYNQFTSSNASNERALYGGIAGNGIHYFTSSISKNPSYYGMNIYVYTDTKASGRGATFKYTNGNTYKQVRPAIRVG